MNFIQIILLSLLFISLSTYLYCGLYLKSFIVESADSRRYSATKKVSRLVSLILAVIFIVAIIYQFKN